MQTQVKTSENLLDVAKIFWQHSEDLRWPTEKIMQELCERYSFPKNELRVRQILKISKVIPEFQEILLKGIHALDYLALLANCGHADQKVFYEKLVLPYRINYNTQKKLFEWLYDWAQRDMGGSITQVIQNLRPVKNLDELTQTIFAARFPRALNS